MLLIFCDMLNQRNGGLQLKKKLKRSEVIRYKIGKIPYFFKI